MTLAVDRLPAAHAYQRQTRRWAAGLLQALPDEWSGALVDGWQGKYRQSRGSESARAAVANANLREIVEQLRGDSDLPLTADEDAIRARATARAKHYQMLRHAITPAMAESLVEDTGAITPSGAVERLCCDRWWRRRLRRAHGRAVERAGIRAGLVRSSRQVYASDVSVTRRRQQKSRNRVMLESMLAVSSMGDELSLAEVVDASVSNPALRRAELMCRLAGMEWVASAIGWQGWFLTLTAPSAYHPTRSYGKRGRRIVDNPLYEGATPRDAQAWLCKIWSRIRAAGKRKEIEWFGLRVAEPHGDGTPHWHLLLFWSPEHTEEAVLSIFRDKALAEYGDERGASGYRFQAKKIDPRRGSAAGYVAKYVAKNIDGAHMAADDLAPGNDMFGRDPISLSERVDAWASTWGIRQFQAVGAPSVTVWRELRRLASDEQMGGLELLREAADAGNWGVFMHTIRELGLSPELVRLAQVDTATGEYCVNRYGEPVAGKVVGVRVGDRACLTRDKIWRIERKRSCSVGAGRKGLERIERRPIRHFGAVSHGVRGKYSVRQGAHLAAGASRTPWSPVNNCTGVQREGRRPDGWGHARAPKRVPEAVSEGAGGVIPGSEGASGSAFVAAADDKHRAIACSGGAGRKTTAVGG